MANVIVIRGTSGSGKTTVVRKALMGLDDPVTTVFEHRSGREKPVIVGYSRPRLFLVGRYDATCGGCDTLSWKGSADDICRIVVREHAAGKHVLFEGLMVSGWGRPRMRFLNRDVGRQLYLIHLTTPLEDCLKAVQDRRDQRAVETGKERGPLNPDNTVSKWHGVFRGSELLKAEGLKVEFLDREVAVSRVKELIA